MVASPIRVSCCLLSPLRWMVSATAEIQVTRFCLICNYVTRIIEPLASRCAKFRFSALGQGPMLDRLRYISKEEDVSCPPAMAAKAEGGCRYFFNSTTVVASLSVPLLSYKKPSLLQYLFNHDGLGSSLYASVLFPCSMQQNACDRLQI